MAKTSKIVPHLSVSEIDENIKKTKGFWKVQRRLVIRHGMTNPASAEAIGKAVGLKKSTVQQLISRYNKQGPGVVNTQGKGGRKYGYLSLEEEKLFLKDCEQKAIAGHYTTVADIQKSFEQRIGKQVPKSTIYNLLKRHDWRKLSPRPHHPKTDRAKQDAFKKTSRSK